MIRIKTLRNAFSPGERIEGTIEWNNLPEADRLEIRLLWYTAGKGDRDHRVVESQAVNRPAASGDAPFRFTAPEWPHSFAGSLVSVLWAIEVVRFPGSDAERIELVIGPGAREIRPQV